MGRARKGAVDYTYGAAMLAVRSAISLSQGELAKHLGVSRRAVGEWEAGNSYPKACHLKALIELGVENQAFTPGSEAEEIRALWKVAHQKVLIDEHWLSTLLEDGHSSRHSLAPLQEHLPARQNLHIRFSVDLTIAIDAVSGMVIVETVRIKQAEQHAKYL
jgi:transcriptional regulator with XRE-family HTH domain